MNVGYADDRSADIEEMGLHPRESSSDHIQSPDRGRSSVARRRRRSWATRDPRAQPLRRRARCARSVARRGRQVPSSTSVTSRVPRASRRDRGRRRTTTRTSAHPDLTTLAGRLPRRARAPGPLERVASHRRARTRDPESPCLRRRVRYRTGCLGRRCLTALRVALARHDEARQPRCRAAARA